MGAPRSPGENNDDFILPDAWAVVGIPRTCAEACFVYPFGSAWDVHACRRGHGWAVSHARRKSARQARVLLTSISCWLAFVNGSDVGEPFFNPQATACVLGVTYACVSATPSCSAPHSNTYKHRGRIRGVSAHWREALLASMCKCGAFLVCLTYHSFIFGFVFSCDRVFPRWLVAGVIVMLWSQPLLFGFCFCHHTNT